MRDHRDVAAALAAGAAGDAWYGPSTASILDGLSAERAARRIGGFAHSVWEIVLHATAWMEEVERRLAGGDPAPPASGDWPAVADRSEAAWARACAAYADAAARLAERIGTADPSHWEQPVGTERRQELGTGVSFAGMVVGVLQHNAYHTGQIALLRKALDAGA